MADKVSLPLLNIADNQAQGIGPLNAFSERIEVIEDTLTQNEQFKKNVAIPYFKDIYKDLVQQSDNKNKGINKVSILTVIPIL